MSSFKFLGANAACGTSVGAASTFEDATEVRLVNTGCCRSSCNYCKFSRCYTCKFHTRITRQYRSKEK